MCYEHLPKCAFQKGISDVKVQVPKARGRSGYGIRFKSQAYQKRAQGLDDPILWFSCEVSSGDFRRIH